MRALNIGLGRVQRSRRRPRLSVVIPVFNVERYLAQCLDSLLAQSYTDLEAILVDDGATDRSMAIAKEYARADGRIRVLRQPNAGLGAARNLGVRASRGDYLAFLDSDDTLPPKAYAAMMSTIERTGSDLVVGALKRNGGRRNAMRLMRQNHQARRERVTLGEMPLILADVFAGNKIYRRSFWDRAGLEFPVGLRYEDQPTLTRAFVAAKQFDVIPEVVYLWRVRDDRSSITQRRHELGDLLDRVESKRMSTRLVRAVCPPNVHDVWFRDILPVDMWEYFRAVPGCTDDFWAALRSAMAEFWSPETVPFEQARVPDRQRLMGCLVRHGRRDDLEELIGFIDEHSGEIVVEVGEDKVVARPSTAAGRELYFAVDERDRVEMESASRLAR